MLYFFSAPLKGWRGVWFLGWVLWEKNGFIPIKTIPLKNQQQIVFIGMLWYRLFNIMANYVTATAVGCLHKRWVAVRSEHIILHYVI